MPPVRQRPYSGDELDHQSQVASCQWPEMPSVFVTRGERVALMKVLSRRTDSAMKHQAKIDLGDNIERQRVPIEIPDYGSERVDAPPLLDPRSGTCVPDSSTRMNVAAEVAVKSKI